jgi:citrate lyase subunit beta/citryl-CoA lyase
MREPRLRRSLLITPGNRPERLAKAATLPADVIVLDLEDGVPPGEKDRARCEIGQFLRSADCGPRERCVRVNAVGTPDLAADLAALPFGHFDCLMVPKVERPAALADIEAALRARGGAHAVDLIVSIETPRGVLDALAIADASRLTSALFFGSGDYSAATGAAVTPAALQFPRATVRAAAAAAGLQALDAAFFAAVKDADATRQDAYVARDLGFCGKLVFHPIQVAVANEVFSPTAAEIVLAMKVVEGYRAAAARGSGTAVIDGSFIAIDLVIQAQQILARAHQIEKRGQQAHAAAR